jgi:hypothetical protein
MRLARLVGHPAREVEKACARQALGSQLQQSGATREKRARNIVRAPAGALAHIHVDDGVKDWEGQSSKFQVQSLTVGFVLNFALGTFNFELQAKRP